MNKKCKKCGFYSSIKWGFKNGRQVYKCKKCNYIFQNTTRKNNQANKLWKEYVKQKKTYKELSDEYGLSIKTIQKIFDKNVLYYEIFYNNKFKTQSTVLLADVVFFSSDLAILFIESYELNKIIYSKVVETENVEVYVNGVNYLKEKGWNIKALVIDGKRGVKEAFNIPVQLCIFHQVKMCFIYITRRPRTEAGKELRYIILRLKETDSESFKYWLEKWHSKWEIYLREKSQGLDGKRHYTHKRVRSAYNSLRRNLHYLFTWERYYNEFKIPTTTNKLDGIISHLKNKVNLHRGLRKDRKIKLIYELLKK